MGADDGLMDLVVKKFALFFFAINCTELTAADSISACNSG
jgi:hypothetical protein